jgi:hypothetical protein
MGKILIKTLVKTKTNSNKKKMIKFDRKKIKNDEI